MKIETKFDIGQEVYYIQPTYFFDKVIKMGKILDIRIILGEENYEEYNFSVDVPYWVDENDVFETEKQAKDKLNQGDNNEM